MAQVLGCLFCSCMIMTCLAAEEVLKRKVLLVQGAHEFLGLGNDLAAVGLNLFIVENRESRILRITLQESGPPVFSGFVAKKGSGPGEVTLPIEIFASSSCLAVKTNRGFSFFDGEGKFEGRIKVFSPRISFTYLNERVYYATSNPEKDTFIEIFERTGQRIGNLAEKFIEVKSSRGDHVSLANNEKYFYSGKLLSDGDMLFYLNASFGQFMSFSLEGRKVHESKVVSEFGARGRFIVGKNLEYLEKPELIEGSEYYTYELFDDAYLSGELIYVLRSTDYVEENELFASETKEILVFEKTSLSLVEKLRFPLLEGERAYSLAVTHVGKIRRIFMMMELEDDYRLVELIQ